MSENRDTIELLENYLVTAGVTSVSKASDYKAIGFRMEDVEEHDWRELVTDLVGIAPTDEWVHQDGFIYQITHIDDTVFPVKLSSIAYEERI